LCATEARLLRRGGAEWSLSRTPTVAPLMSAKD
jgi:hypothetical protein